MERICAKIVLNKSNKTYTKSQATAGFVSISLSCRPIVKSA